MRGDIGVRISDGTTHRIVTSKVEDLRFSKSAPGGYLGGSMTVRLPYDLLRDLGPADKVTFYDARHAGTLFEGHTENPGATDGPAGQEWDMSLIGTMALASDQAQQLIYIDYSFEGWERAEDFGSAASATTEVSTRPTDALQCLLCQFNPGQPITTNSRARLWYRAVENAAMQVGAVTFSTVAGITDPNYAMQVSIRASDATNIATVVTRTASTSAVAHHFVAPTDFAHGGSYLTAQLTRIGGGSTNVANDDTWAAFASLRIAGARKDRHGNFVNMRGAYNVYAHEVAEDLIGRLLANVCDGPSAVIDTGSYPIAHFAFKEAVTAEQVFDALSLFEPDLYWGIGATLPSGKNAMWYRRWPTRPRYVISKADGYEAPGGEADLCNRVAVSFVDSKGKPQTKVVTVIVPALGARIVDADPVDLDGTSTPEDAQRIGEQILAAKNSDARAARAAVNRPILDLYTGNTVMPWEIEPGYPVRVLEEGVDLRLTEMEYVDSDCATFLTLGRPTRTLDQMLAAFRRR